MRRKKLGVVVSFCNDSQLKLQVSDKKARFVVVPLGASGVIFGEGQKGDGK